MKKNKNISDYIKSNRKGNREAELEFFKRFPNYNKVYKSKKQYNRKLKHKIKLLNQ